MTLFSCCCPGRRAVTDASLLNNESSQATPSFAADACDMVRLAFPLFIAGVSFVGMKVTDTALLGHSGTRYLEAASLSDLWTSATGVFITTRVVGIFCSTAFGAGQHHLVGIWLQVAFAVLAPVCLFVAISWACTGAVMKAWDKSEQLVSDSSYYALVLMLCLPVRVGFSQLTTFLSSQRIVRPGAQCATLSMTLNLVFGLILVLGIPIPGWTGFGFVACPWVTTTVEFVQLGFLYFVYCAHKRLHVKCWPGWSLKHVTRERVKLFLGQYIPSALSVASDFWRVSVIGVVAAQLGDVNIAVWNSSYRICWITLTFLGSLGGAMSTKLGHALGKGDAEHARRIAFEGITLAFSMALVLSVFIVLLPRQCAMIFSSDEVILEAFAEVRWPLATFVILMNLCVMTEKVPVAAGRSRAVFYAGLVGSWVGQVPLVILCTKYWRKDLVGLYTGVSAGYGLLFIILILYTWRIDWEKVVQEARARSETARQVQAEVSMQAGDNADEES